ncbi:hypothetical protein [Sphingomonas sp.]|jgi:tetratricopeptide (TPR) repeat protein|uniref:hypothetical protein n=1 Tax=Sphingomonas sp. TaxID=28214 RepID=UPI002E0E067F
MLKGRSSKKWSGLAREARPLLLPALIGLAGAAAASAYTVARLAEKARPDFALQLYPSLAPAKTHKADALLADTAAGRGRFMRARSLAFESLAADPLNPAALRVIAATEPASSPRLAPLLDLASKASRREVGVQLLQIELAVTRNRVDQALHHYDQALKVKPSVGSILFPVLLNAATDRELLPSIRCVIAANPVWLRNLSSWVLENPELMPQFALLVPALPLRSEAASQDFGHAIVEGLVEQRRYPEAYSSYLTYKRAMLLTPKEEHRPYRPFEWMPVESPDFGAEANDENNAFELYASQNATGDVLRRLTRNAPGRYRLSFAVEPLEGRPQSFQTSITCPASSGSAPRLPSKVSAVGNIVRVEYAVPPNCPFQWIQMTLKAGTSPVRMRLSRFGHQTI